MEFREKIEIVLRPLIQELKKRLAKLPTIQVLDYYQFRIDLVQPDKSNVPDGFIIKWRYLWALILSEGAVEPECRSELDVKQLDELIEKIFETYSAGAVFEPGRVRGSEREFLTRLGLGLKVREPDILAFPEQIQRWALTRLEPFNGSYFVPCVGLSFAEILRWFGALISATQTKLDAWVSDFTTIKADIESIKAEVETGKLDREGAQKKARELMIAGRLELNGLLSERAHIFSIDELQCGIPQPALRALIELFGIRPGEVDAGYFFPHEENPLEYKTFVVLPSGSLYFIDPANAYRIVAKTFERQILADARLRNRYLRNRDRATERWATENIKKVFPSAEVYPNYYLQKGGNEKDLLVRYGDTIVLIESKNCKIRTFKGTAGDLIKFESDFENSIQYGYEQALQVKHTILGAEQSTFFDEKGRTFFVIKRQEIKRFYIICLTITPRGPFGTDLSYELKKSNDEPFPLALNLLDFDTICKHLCQPEQFLAYLRAREQLHGRATTGDELNYAGYFLKHGNLDIQNGTFLTDDFSGIFDRAWYREKGITVEEPDSPAYVTSMSRQGNRVIIEHPTGRKERINVPPEWVERATGKPLIRMRGSQRNQPCPCGSGQKLKHCHGVA